MEELWPEREETLRRSENHLRCELYILWRSFLKIFVLASCLGFIKEGRGNEIDLLWRGKKKWVGLNWIGP